MKYIAILSIKSVYGSIDSDKKDNTFEVKIYLKDIWIRFYD